MTDEREMLFCEKLILSNNIIYVVAYDACIPIAFHIIDCFMRNSSENSDGKILT